MLPYLAVLIVPSHYLMLYCKWQHVRLVFNYWQYLCIQTISIDSRYTILYMIRAVIYDCIVTVNISNTSSSRELTIVPVQQMYMLL